MKLLQGCDGTVWQIDGDGDGVGVQLDADADGLYRPTDGDTA